MTELTRRADSAVPDHDHWPPARPQPGSVGGVAARLTLGMLVVTALMLALGFALTRAAMFAGVRAWDAEVERWWYAHRTPTFDAVTHYGSSMADTITAIVVTTVGALALRAWLGRWYESLVLVIAIGGELLYFLALTALVGRHRPDVPNLDPPRLPRASRRGIPVHRSHCTDAWPSWSGATHVIG